MGHLTDPRNINVTLSIKQTNWRRELIREDHYGLQHNQMCRQITDRQVHPDKGKTLIFCIQNVPSGFYLARVQASGVFVDASYRNGTLVKHECQNVDGDIYKMMNLRWPIKRLNSCSQEYCPSSSCQHECFSMMFGQGNSFFCDGKLSLHPQALVMEVDHFTSVADKKAVCFRMAEKKVPRLYLYRQKGDVKDFEILLKRSCLLIALNKTSILALNKPSTFCESEAFLKRKFMKQGQFVCVDLLDERRDFVFGEEKVFYSDQLLYNVNVANGQPIQHSAISEQAADHMKSLGSQGGLNNQTKQTLEEEGCDRVSCSLWLTGQGFAACRNDRLLYVKEGIVFLVQDPQRPDVFPLRTTPVPTTPAPTTPVPMTRDQVVDKLRNITDELLNLTQVSRDYYVSAH